MEKSLHKFLLVYFWKNHHNCECFEKIVEILEFCKTILELGSGKSSELLNKFYNVISVEDSKDWLNKYNTYILYGIKKI